MIVNFLRDPMWQFIGVIISFIALLLTIWLANKQSQRKEVLWDITKYTSLSSFNISDKVKVTITFENAGLEDVSLVHLKLWNSGNVEVLCEDYNVPIRFSFGKEARVLDAKVLKGVPSNIKDIASIIVKPDGITLKPLLLNSKDSIELEVLLNKFSGSVYDIKIDGRIAGVKQLGRQYENESYIRSISASLFKITILGIKGLALGILGFVILGVIITLLSSIDNSHKLLNFLLFESQVIGVASFPSISLYFALKARFNNRIQTYKENFILLLVPLLLFLLVVVGLDIAVWLLNPKMNFIIR